MEGGVDRRIFDPLHSPDRSTTATFCLLPCLPRVHLPQFAAENDHFADFLDLNFADFLDLNFADFLNLNFADFLDLNFADFLDSYFADFLSLWYEQNRFKLEQYLAL